VKNLLTNGWLVTDLGDKLTGSEEAYAVTTTTSKIGACARSVLILQKANENEGDELVRYGQDIRLKMNQFLSSKDLYLASQPKTPSVFARFSRQQEVSLSVKKNFNTVWRIQPTSGAREDRRGEPVYANDAVIFEHVGTNQYLSNDRIPYRNDFGNEMEVSACNITTHGKTQLLVGEVTGHLVRENTHKTVLH